MKPAAVRGREEAQARRRARGDAVQRMVAIAREELHHILRDPRSLGVALLLPLVMVLIFGYGIDTELRDLPLAILDRDRTPASRERQIQTSPRRPNRRKTSRDSPRRRPGFS